ncbi:NADH dehydrogenase [ubiquinone] flavoprotein 3, mitochondrial [Sipha flava]|uniref:NADH dehydrogenase [ubiquinone] flavoprotein 3, mitochondrial n=1 Tax=Sipha flava TaxID=143950 RepID=A0A8B8FYW4_9HEMI|nr:NADH dehydrogenase [ubiquinone] flavoprotein 3, mitochondrial [Sipha flava]
MNRNNVLIKSCLINNQFRRYVATTEKPKETIPNVKGLSSKVIIASPPPERIKKAAANGPYKNPQYFSYHKNSYFDAEIEMHKYRLPQPSSLK